MAPNAPPADFVKLGTLGKTFQLEGGLRFYPLGDAEADAVLTLKSVWLTGTGEVAVRRARPAGQHIILYLSRALDRETAQTLVNKDVYAAASALPEPEAGDIYVDELLDLPVYLDGTLYGEVKEVLEAGLQDLLVVRAATGEVMVPLQAPYVEVTDDGVYLVDVPEGLLEG
ncbi:ribosome maturation factor RimM [soil metagenome]